MNLEPDLMNQPIKKILLINPGVGVTASWLDGKYPLEYFESQGRITIIEKLPRLVTKEDIQNVDLIYCIRCKELKVYQFLLEAKKFNKPFVYFTDDNFFIIPENSTERQKKDVELAIALVSNVDAVVVVSQELLSTIEQYNKNIVFIRPYQIFVDNLDNPEDNGKTVIGHMSTIHRETHLECVIPAIKMILNEFNEQVCFEFIGHKPMELMDYPQVKQFDFIVDYMEFRKFLASRHWDIGLAPLKDNPFIRSKTGNKFREFGANKICGIYSNVICYNQCVKHRETGYIVENSEKAWYQAIKELLLDSELRRKIVNASYQYVKENYNMEIYCNQLWDVFEKLW